MWCATRRCPGSDIKHSVLPLTGNPELFRARSRLLGNLPLIIAEIRLELRAIQKSATISGLATMNVLKSIRQVAAPYSHSCPVGGSAISAPDLIVVLALICFVNRGRYKTG
jgi:hypothetical protein